MAKSPIPPGLGQRDWIQTFDPKSVPSWGNAAVAADTLYAADIGRLARPIPIANFRINVGNAAGTVNIALCTRAADGVLTPICATGSVAPGGTGVRTLAAAVPISAPVGVDLSLAIVGSDGALTIGRAVPVSATVGAVANQLQSKASVGVTLPETIDTLTTASLCPWIWAG